MTCKKCFDCGRVTIGGQDLLCICPPGHKNLSAMVDGGDRGNLTFESPACFLVTPKGEKVYQDFYRRMESEIPTLESCACGRSRLSLNEVLEIFTDEDCFENRVISLNCCH